MFQHDQGPDDLERSQESVDQPVTKVLAYVWRGHQLLVFRQPEHPEAGLQVPAGTVEAGEDIASALFRELHEETGLVLSAAAQPLASYLVDMRPYGKDEQHLRHVFALRCHEDAPDAWRHWEEHCSDGRGPIAYDLSWHSLRSGLPDLAADQGRWLPELLELIAQELATEPSTLPGVSP